MNSLDQNIDPVQEKHYNVRARVPHFLDIFQQWHDRSQAFRKRADVALDIRYADGEKATLDLFYPHATPRENLPVLIFIHGGYWQAMDKSASSFIAEPFVNEGIAVAIVNYDLCPNVSLAHIVDQIRQAVSWAWEDGEKYGLNPHDIHISGHSAGGHLAGELLATDWQRLQDHHVHQSVIKSCVALSGLFNLVPLVQTTINTNVGLSFEEAKRLSPLEKNCPNTCPTLAVYGGSEGEGFEMQSLKAVEHWRKEGLRADALKLPEANHFDACEALADPQSPVYQWVLQHIKP